MESYKHKFAKTTLAGWLRRVAANAGHDNAASLGPISWRVNRRSPHHGIWLEYPVCLDAANEIAGLFPVWDEWGALGDANPDRYFDVAPPTFKECLDGGLTPIAIFDVAVQHKGSIAYALEVVHRGEVSSTKRDYLDRIRRECGGPRVYRIDADWILSRCGIPKALECTEIT